METQKESNKAWKSAKKYLAEELKNDSVDALSAQKIVFYEVLLSWGGPATRIYGRLDENNEPETAVFQYQNWGTDWTTAEGSENDQTLLDYAREFYWENLD